MGAKNARTSTQAEANQEFEQKPITTSEAFLSLGAQVGLAQRVQQKFLQDRQFSIGIDGNIMVVPVRDNNNPHFVEVVSSGLWFNPETKRVAPCNFWFRENQGDWFSLDSDEKTLEKLTEMYELAKAEYDIILLEILRS